MFKSVTSVYNQKENLLKFSFKVKFSKFSLQKKINLKHGQIKLKIFDSLFPIEKKIIADFVTNAWWDKFAAKDWELERERESYRQKLRNTNKKQSQREREKEAWF